MILTVIMIFVFFALAVYLLSGRGWWLIAGLNTQPKSERAKYDLKAMCRFMGKIMLVCTFALAMILCEEFWPQYHPGRYGSLLIMGTALFAVVWANTGNRFLLDKPEKKKKRSLRKRLNKYLK